MAKAKVKIQKNLSDADMLKGYAEQESFENKMLRMDDGVSVSERKSKKAAPKGKTQDEFYREFLTDAIQAQIGKALLTIKMEYFKEGMDFSLQVKREGRNIVLETAPKQMKR